MFFLHLICLVSTGQQIKTRWAEQVTVENVWQIYPRPQLKRVNWKNLNGLWKYQVTEMNRKKKDVHYGDEILVPFSINRLCRE